MRKSTSQILLALLGIIFLGGFYLLDRGGVEEKSASFNEDAPTILLTNLEIPWEIAFLNSVEGTGTKVLITERPGRLLLVGKETKDYELKNVFHIGEGGLLGLALHPDFHENQFIYLYYTYKEDNRILNRVSRFTFKEDSLTDEKVIISGIPGASYHDGGRIKFGPDGKLYITTGDHGDKLSAQNQSSLAGKILRLNDDGSIPKDNPFSDSPVYSYGHRNPQGLAWDKDGNLWITEHGQDATDEINLIKPGKNYGWPIIIGDEKREGMESPVYHSGSDTWAPSGAVIKDDKLYFAGLAGRAIYIFDLKTKTLDKFFEGEFGRLRTITLGPDGAFYLLTSNRDGRNLNPDRSDDRLIRLPQIIFQQP